MIIGECPNLSKKRVDYCDNSICIMPNILCFMSFI